MWNIEIKGYIIENKKQAFNIIESICKLNNDQWNNKAGSYNDVQESAYQIEEALEGFSLDGLEQLFDRAGDDYSKMYKTGNDNILPGAKHFSRAIVALADDVESTWLKPLADVDRFDKGIDAIYFAIGSMHKLGLSPYQIVEGIQVVHNANLAKSGKKDSNGKVIKTNDFLAPEPLLQKILDNRITK